MIQNLRLKVIGIIMSMAVVLLIVVFFGMYVVTEQNYRRRSEETIRTALMAEMPDGPENNVNPGMRGEMDKFPPQPDEQKISDKELAGPKDDAVTETDNYGKEAVLVLKKESDGTVMEIKNTTVHQTETEYEHLIEAVESEGSDRGELKNEKLRYQYYKNENNGTACYVFADMYEEMQALSEQIIHSIAIGTAALLLFFLAALWFSRWAIHPIEEAWKREQQFVADASHELKTPLTVILANAEMILQDMNNGKDNDRKIDDKNIDNKNIERMHFIKEEADRMKGLTEALLNLARSDAGTVNLEKKEISISEIAELQAASFEPVMFENGKSLETKIEDNIKIQGDEKKIRQLFSILLDNACKYALPGSEIVFTLKRNGEKGSFICVENEADKLTEEMCGHLFDRFYRTDTSRGRAPGYGLGLSIAQSIVKEHGGTIKAVYENGKMKMRVEL